MLLGVDIVLLNYTDLLKSFINNAGSLFIFLVVDFALVAGEGDFLLASSVKIELFAKDVDTLISNVMIV